MITEILSAMLRTFIAYILIMIMTRLIGRKAISNLTFFDFSVSITLGSITAYIGFGGNTSLQSVVTVLITLVLLVILTDLLHLKSKTFNKIVNAKPLILIDNNSISDKNMKKARIALSDLIMLLREKDAFNIADVQYAVIEINGELSVLLKSDKSPLTPSDMNLHFADKSLSKDLIWDGRIQYENLSSSQRTEAWLTNELYSRGIRDISDVFYASLSSDGQLYVSRRKQDAGMDGSLQ